MSPSSTVGSKDQEGAKVDTQTPTEPNPPHSRPRDGEEQERKMETIGEVDEEDAGDEKAKRFKKAVGATVSEGSHLSKYFGRGPSSPGGQGFINTEQGSVTATGPETKRNKAEEVYSILQFSLKKTLYKSGFSLI